MDKKMVIGIVVLVVVIAGGWYLLSKAPVSQQSAQPAAVDQAAATQTGSGTVGDLLAMGPSECTVTVDENGSSGQGTVYVANGKMSGAFAATVNGQEMHTYMINDGSSIYTWTDQSAQGFEMPVSMATSSASGSATQSVSATTPAQYSCTPWVEDDSVFTPPASITFTDLSSMKVPAGAPKKK